MVNISYASRIKLRIQQIQTEMSALARELDDLKIADRVLTRLSQGIDEHSGDLISNDARKKSNLTIADQIKLASESFGPLDSKALHRAISEKFVDECVYKGRYGPLSKTTQPPAQKRGRLLGIIPTRMIRLALIRHYGEKFKSFLEEALPERNFRMTIDSSDLTTKNSSYLARDDGRRSLLVYLNADLIKDIKKAALDEDRNVYELVEEAMLEWLKQMLQTVRDACQFDPKAIDYALSEQIESLEDLIGHEPGLAEAFFKKTYVTGGMNILLRQGLQRLAGSSGQAVFELKQSMGGGKTHSMLALGYLAANPSLSNLVPPDVTKGIALAKARVVAISGRSISHEKHLWGDIAEQLGKADEFVEFYKGSARAPNEKDWIDLIGDEPTLILLDELPPYFTYGVTQPVGSGTLADVTVYAVSNLLSAALKLKRLCVVISNLTGSYSEAEKKIASMVNKSVGTLQQEAGRQAKSITPVELGSDEIYRILRRRLLLNDPTPSVIDSAATAFADAISDAVKSKTVSKSAEQIGDEVAASYPFHPSFKHILALFKDNEKFRQTRGLMTLAAMMVRSVQSRKVNDVFLIGCQHIDLAQADIRDSLTNIYDLSGAIAQDIAGTESGKGHAQIIDEQMGSDAASQVASLVLMASLPEASGAVKGLSKLQLVENLVAPHRSPIEFDDAFEKLRTECWYLHRRDNDAWVFSKNENLRKKIDKYADGAPQPKVDAEMERRLKAVFEPTRKVAYSQMLALPRVEDIDTKNGRLLLVLSPDRKVPPEDADRLFKAVVQKNNFCILTGDGSDMAKLEDRVRRIWAVEKVKVEDGGDKSPNIAELNEEAETAEFEFYSTLTSLFNRIYYPGRNPRAGDEGLMSAAIKMLPTKGKDGKSNSIDGESAIEEALSATSASKLIKEVNEANVEALRTRAEEMLWMAGTERRAKWKDIEEQAICNVRWIWLPAKGLDEIRKHAVKTGAWRDNGDGYVEKGPFPPDKTSVKAFMRDRDDEGKATIDLTPVNGGDKVRIHYSTTDDVSDQSPIVPDVTFESNETVLWFLAVDPDGKHETGAAEKWTNTLSITHDPKEVMGKRSVTLTVKPRGEIRWNIDGTNVKEGKIYAGSIEIPGTEDVTLYTYAEDSGVSVTKTFTIRAVTGGKATIDPLKPASVAKRTKLATTADTYVTIRAGKKTKAEFGSGVSVTVGKGDKNATTRFGPGTSLSSEAVETFITAARAAIGDEAAEVEFSFGEFRFASGAALTEFLEETSGQIKIEVEEMDPHHFTVEIPAARNDPVIITEQFGLRGGSNGLPDSIIRCSLPRFAWNGISEEAKRILNERLKEKKLPSSRWTSGTNMVERLLGRELCTLAWAVEAANKDLIPNAVRNWVGLRPDERWWLFSMAAAMTGSVDDADVGWRKAIRVALTENPTGEEVTDFNMSSAHFKPTLMPFSLKDAPSMIERIHDRFKTGLSIDEILKYGTLNQRIALRPRIGDTFAGGGSIPLEAAVLGCDVLASDLNPIACMLTWGALNIIGASNSRREIIKSAQVNVANDVDEEIKNLEIEHDENGNRAKYYLYCLETRCPQTQWMIPLVPSWVISKARNVVAILIPNYSEKRFDIEILSNATDDDIVKASTGTVQNGRMVYVLDGTTYSTPIKTLRGDKQTPDGNSSNNLRLWEKLDFCPNEQDIFQERLYCIQWIKKESLQSSRQETFFASVTQKDIERELKVAQIVRENIAVWQDEGLIPDMKIETGKETEGPIRTNGWTYWHHLFNARQLHQFGLWKQKSTDVANYLWLCRALDYNNKGCQWVGQSGYEKTNNFFSGPALRTTFCWGARAFPTTEKEILGRGHELEPDNDHKIVARPAQDVTEEADLFVTDPPYADAVRYEEITEFFIAWVRRNPPDAFKSWTWDSRRPLAIKGDGEDFRLGMVKAYKAMADHMPDNGLQVVMFTHQDAGVWGDMAQIFWGAGLQVVAAWYIATETTSELKKGGYVQGTVIIILRKRKDGESGYKDEIVQEVKYEVAEQIDTMSGLNQSLKGHGRIENLFEDADLQMAGYAAALRVLTKYTKIDGVDMTKEAVRSRVKGEKNIVGEIIEFAVQVANEHMVPEGMLPKVWGELSGSERFFYKMLDIEETGANKLDNYQNFSRAFRVPKYDDLMGSMEPNKARLKTAKEFKKSGFEGEFGGSKSRALLFAINELQNDIEGYDVLSHLHDLIPDYFNVRDDLVLLAEYISKKRAKIDDAESRRLSRFSSRHGRLDHVYLKDRLKGASEYLRIAGYFRSSIFELVNEEIESIGKVRVICNSDLDPGDINAAKQAREQLLKERWNEVDDSVESFLRRPRYRKLYELLKKGNVEIRVVSRTDAPFLHGKAGIIRQPDGSATSFMGSLNETREGWTENYELVWEDSSDEGVAWVEDEFEHLWKLGKPLPDAIIEEIGRSARRVEIQLEELKDQDIAPAALVETNLYRGGEQLMPWQQAFVGLFVQHREVYGQVRLLLADEVGVGKTLSLAGSALVSVLMNDGPVLILCPATLTIQWQMELKDKLNLPSAVWLSGQKAWQLDPDEQPMPSIGAEGILKCPRQIAIVSTGLIVHMTEERRLLKNKKFGLLILDEAHRAHRARGAKSKSSEDRKANNLLEFMKEAAGRARHVLLGTATPIQTDIADLWDLMEVLSQGVNFVLGDAWSKWRSMSKAIPMITGTTTATTDRDAWEWFRNPMPPSTEKDVIFGHMRNAIALPAKEFVSVMPFGQIPDEDDFVKPLFVDDVLTDSNGLTFFQRNNPVVRHVVLRRRETLEKAGLIPRIPVDIHPMLQSAPAMFDGLGLRTSNAFDIAYEASEKFTKAFGKRKKAAGFLKGMLRQRICSSVASGLSTARKLLEGRPLDDDEFLLELDDEKLDAVGEERLHLQTLIDSLERDQRDPKLDAVLHYLSERRWLDLGCIVFSQYFDTVKWIAEHLTSSLPSEIVAVYAGAGKSGLYVGGEWKSVQREEIKKAVKERRIRLVVATDAACEGLNLQTLGTLINIDLPWNPSRLEQRIGRIKRFGQRRDKVDMANLVYHGTIDETVYEKLSSRMQDRYNIFGTLPDVIKDDWIDDIETLSEKLNEFTTKRKTANAFDIRYADDVVSDGKRWELCERVLARVDVTKRLSRGWNERD
eukprot:gene17817-18044_t